MQKWARLLYPLALLLGPISHGFGSAATTYAHFLERALCAPRCRTLQNAEMLGTLPLAMGLDANELLACAKLNACMDKSCNLVTRIARYVRQPGDLTAWSEHAPFAMIS